MTARLLLCAVVTLTACGPREPTCGAVSAHVATLFEPADVYAREIEAAFLGRCVNDSWSVEIRRCVLSTSSLQSPKNCKALMSASQAASLDKELELAELRASQKVLPPICVELEAQIHAAQTCEALPQEVRDQLKANLVVSKKEWDARANKALLAPGCSASLQALRQATTECAPGTKTAGSGSATR